MEEVRVFVLPEGLGYNNAYGQRRAKARPDHHAGFPDSASGRAAGARSGTPGS
jgi:hypothetical protein